eukprot:scaffold276432_cov36-Tisochrysis_lutea.AAC.1
MRARWSSCTPPLKAGRGPYTSFCSRTSPMTACEIKPSNSRQSAKRGRTTTMSESSTMSRSSSAGRSKLTGGRHGCCSRALGACGQCRVVAHSRCARDAARDVTQVQERRGARRLAHARRRPQGARGPLRADHRREQRGPVNSDTADVAGDVGVWRRVRPEGEKGMKARPVRGI